jgi:hypothetical protein
VLVPERNPAEPQKGEDFQSIRIVVLNAKELWI